MARLQPRDHRREPREPGSACCRSRSTRANPDRRLRGCGRDRHRHRRGRSSRSAPSGSVSVGRSDRHLTERGAGWLAAAAGPAPVGAPVRDWGLGRLDGGDRRGRRCAAMPTECRLRDARPAARRRGPVRPSRGNLDGDRPGARSDWHRRRGRGRRRRLLLGAGRSRRAELPLVRPRRRRLDRAGAAAEGSSSLCPARRDSRYRHRLPADSRAGRSGRPGLRCRRRTMARPAARPADAIVRSVARGRRGSAR